MGNLVLTKIISSVTGNIPIPLLQKAVVFSETLTIDEFIKKEIMIKRINIDMMGRVGKITHLQLNPSWRLNNLSLDNVPINNVLSNGVGYYKIPPSARSNLPIIAVESIIPVGVGGGLTAGVGMGGDTNAYNMMSEVIDSRIFNVNPATPSVELVDDDIVCVSPDILTTMATLTCKLGYDENYTNSGVSFIENLKQLAVIATKAWIWTRLVFPIESNMVVGGYELGVAKEIVDKYESALDDYQSKLNGTIYSDNYDERNLPNLMMKML